MWRSRIFLTVCSSVSDEKVPWTSSQYISLFHAEPGVSMKLTIWFLCLIILFTCCTWQGVLKHGFGFWDDIFADTSLGFPDAIGDYFSIAQSAFCPAVILRPLPSSQDTISSCHLPVCLPVCWVCLDLMEKIA